MNKKDISIKVPKWDDWADADLSRPIISEEEVKKRQEEHLQSKITPELLKFFNWADADELVRYFYSTPSQTTSDFNYGYDLSKISKKAKEFLAKEVKDRRIIELGNKGYRNINCDDKNVFCNLPAAELLGLGARSYEGCDPKYNVDGLTFLLRQPDESAIVTSFGVLEDGVLYMPKGCGSIDHLLPMYTAELGKQIYRVTPKGAITLHGLDCSRDLENTGFIIEESVTRDLKRGNISGGLVVLRKK